MLNDLLAAIPSLLPVLITLAAVSVGLWLCDRLMRRRARYTDSSGGFARQIVMLLLTAAGIVAIVIALPVEPATRGQLLSLFGLVLTAIIALSSTTVVSNAMAGLMLRAVGSIRIGDFVRTADHFGRVTERGLFHTEIQTEDRDLTTLPNLYLVSNPLTVVRRSGTIISCSVSLGYDTSHQRIEALLLEAGAAAGLEDCFVQILELGDFSVSYRAAGFLADVTHLVTARSKLRAAVLDTLHDAGVEIVSPTYMAQRPLPPDLRVIPRDAPIATPTAEPENSPEALIFDKAEEAESIERLRAARGELAAEIEGLEAQLAAADEDARSGLERELARRRVRLAAMDASLAESAGAEPG